MSETLIMELFSREPLAPATVQRQLAFLSTFERGLFVPRTSSLGPFDPDNIAEPIRVLGHPGGELRFQRSHATFTIRNRGFSRMFVKEPGDRLRELPATQPEPSFCTSWSVWMKSPGIRKRGDALLERFLLGAFAASAADYGFLTDYDDYKAKNLSVTYDAGGGSRSIMLGDDPEHGICGLYWLNVFGPTYVEWFGDRLLATDAERQPDGSVLLRFGDSPEAAVTEAALQAQAAVIAALGDDAFFDLRRPTRALRTPPLRR